MSRSIFGAESFFHPDFALQAGRRESAWALLGGLVRATTYEYRTLWGTSEVVSRRSQPAVPKTWPAGRTPGERLLPKLLPNSVAPAGTETDKERFARRKCQTVCDVPGRVRTRRNALDRIWRPVLYQLSYTPTPLARALTARLFDDFCDDAGADGAAALADRKAQPLIHCDRRNQLDLHRDVVARHHHLGPLRQMYRPGHIRRAEVKLRPVVAEKRRVPPAFLLGQDIGLALKPCVRRDRSRCGQHLPALDLLALGAAQQRPDVVARLALVEQFAEHLHSRHHRLGGRPQSDNLHLVTDLDHPALNPPGHHRAAPRDREHVLNRHQKRPVLGSLRLRDVVIHRRHQRADRVATALRVAPFQRKQRRAPDHRKLVPRKAI